jgi:hypothetical protein
VAIDKPSQPTRVGKVVTDFIGGAISGSKTDDSLSAFAGDLAASLIPGVGPARDFWIGLRDRDPIRLVTGAIGFIPGVGAAATATKKATEVAAREVAKGGLKAGSMRLSQMAAQSARKFAEKAATDPNFKKQLVTVQRRAFERIATEAVTQLKSRWDESVRDHDHFKDAQRSMFDAFECKPDPSWHPFLAPDGKQVVGKHLVSPGADGSLDELISRYGFRFVDADEGDRDRHGLMWWKQPADTNQFEVGVETFRASPDKMRLIGSAYLNQLKSFRWV